jgi:hypothetical protein
MVHYIFQFAKNCLLNGIAKGFADRMEDLQAIGSYFSGRKRQAVSRAIQFSVDTDTAQIKLVIQHDAGKANQPIAGFDKTDVDFGDSHGALPFSCCSRLMVISTSKNPSRLRDASAASQSVIGSGDMS